jgi:chemotaxis signal transduction protein
MSDGERAQGISCDGLAVALPYSWARGVVDSFELSGVPNAPGWLAGAANVDGRILAVVDLARWARPDTHAAPAAAARQRLLVGGDGAQAFALRFQGLPALLRCGPAAQQPADADLPDALAPYVRGTAQAEGQAAAWPVLDMPGLARAWAAELAA